MANPPPVPETIQTPFYCEENIYLLCEAFLSQQQEVSAVFISNETKTVALWNQRLSKDAQTVVVWDYHVVLLLRTREGQHWIYDFDTRLPLPCLMKDYLQHTFQQDLPHLYQSLFRIVPGLIYVEHFASDRSHMLTDAISQNPEESCRYRSPPPAYTPLCGKKATETNNLMRSFVCMIASEETFGDVNDLRAMVLLAESVG
ncbi:N-terminal glutamine amidase-domain-containing protein [Mycena crocata]|nr:N-terminal glutamine amidase-domain-containing protein [Mycena crocata]